MSVAHRKGADLKKQFSRTCIHCSYKIILLGDYGVGKTALLARIKHPESTLPFTSSGNTYQDSIDYCTKTFEVASSKKVQVDIWDTGGAERFRGSLTRNYYKAATGIVLMYDATNPSSLTNLHTWIEDAERYTTNVTYFLVGNKYDISQCHQVDDGLADAFALHANIALHFKISTKHSDHDTIMGMLQKMVVLMNSNMEWGFSSTTKHVCTHSFGRDTVSLIPVENSENRRCCLKFYN